MQLRYRVTNNRVFNYGLGQLFRLWKWLGVSVLEVEIGIRYEPQVIYKDHPQPEAKGPQRPNRKKLTAREVKTIRDMNRIGVASQAVLAKMYDVNPATVSRIVRGQYYKELASA